MSGYFGLATLDDKPIDDKLLDHITEQLRFRGLNGTSVWKNNRCGGCFSLMQTGPAPQSKQQPVVLDQRYFLWGDVRVDGQSDLRKSLGEQTPSPGRTETSEELLLRAWRKWGEAALDRVIGDFSFALWDEQDEGLICARDFIGARPFYYAHIDNAFFFGNTLNVFRHVPGFSCELDEQFIADFLVEGLSLDAERTVYRDVRRLPAGHLLKFSKNGIEVRRFCKLPVEEPLEFSRQGNYVDAYLELLREAVNDRLPRHEVALQLSGGLDSSSVCAVAADLAGARGDKTKLRAFTIGCQSLFCDDEPQFASLSAQHLGLTHQVFTDAELIAFAGANSPGWNVPEPDQEYFFLQERQRFLRIAEYSNVVLGGDGGDDVLTGQSWPYLVYLWRKRSWKRIANDFGGYFWVNRRFPPLRAGLRRKIQEFLSPNDIFAGYPQWLNGHLETRLQLRQRWRERWNPTAESEHPRHPQAYRTLHEGYWAGVLEMEDAGWSGVPLETRAPLLDLRVLRFVLRLPTVPWCVDKYLARHAMANKLPDAVVRRPKAPMAGDPVEHCTLPPDWPAHFSSCDHKEMESFVNWDKWCETLSGPKGSLSWLNLRPLSLAYWLKAVENRMGIK